MDAKQVHDYLYDYLTKELERYRGTNESRSLDLAETSFYRGMIAQCRATLKELEKTKL